MFRPMLFLAVFIPTAVLLLGSLPIAWALKQCTGSDTASWHNCEGNQVFHNGDAYIGGWTNGKKHGRGVNYFSDGGIYEGEYQMDSINGRGTMFWADGRVWVGIWENHNWLRGLQHAPGKAPGYVYESIAKILRPSIQQTK